MNSIFNTNKTINLIDEINDAQLLAIAYKRLENLDSNNFITQEEVYKNLGIKDEDLKDYDLVEFE